jgi:nitrate reductase delta subunit
MRTFGRCLSLFAAIFEYPGFDYAARASTLARELPEACPEAAEAFAPFAAHVAGRRRAELEELFFRTFDLAPQCAPYLSVHLFGEESFKRAELMTGLAEAYGQVGLAHSGELPDHLSVLLRLGPCLPDWPELVEACVLRGVASMRKDAHQAQNPYAPALEALFVTLAAEIGLSRGEAERLVDDQIAEGNRRADGRIAPGPVVGTNQSACHSPFAEEGARG